MATRNFWIDADIDGRATMLSGGPRNKSGGMEVRIYQRETGGIVTAAQIFCTATGDKLVTEIWSGGKLAGKFETIR